MIYGVDKVEGLTLLNRVDLVRFSSPKNTHSWPPDEAVDGFGFSETIEENY